MAKIPRIARVTDYILPWTILLAPLLIFSYRVPSAVALGAATAVFVPVFFKGYFLSHGWPTRPLILAFILCSLPSLYATAFPEVTIEKLLLFTLSVCVYLSVVSVRRDFLNLAGLTGLVASAAITLAITGPFITDFAAKNRFFKIPWAEFSPFRFPEVLDPNILANLMNMILPVILALSLSGQRLGYGRKIRTALWLGVGLLISSLLVTESRAGYTAALFGMGLLLLFFFRKLWIAYGLVGTGGLAAFFLLPAHLRLEAFITAGTVTTWESRKEVWSRALYMIQDFPFTGIGAGTYGTVANLLYPFFINSSDPPLPHSHNLFLQVAVDFGVPSLVAFTALFTAAILLGWKAYRRFEAQRQVLGATLACGYLSGLSAMLVHGLLDAPLWLTKPSPVPFFFMGVLVSLYVLAKDLGGPYERVKVRGNPQTQRIKPRRV